jgi:hypothetical protein
MNDELHWSFGDNPILRNKVFPEGFSKQESTLPKSDFDINSDWRCSYDLVYTGPQPFDNDQYVYYGAVEISRKRVENGIALNIKEINQMGQDYRCERQYINTECLCMDRPMLPLGKDSVWKITIDTKNQMDGNVTGMGRMVEEGRIESGRVMKKDLSGKWYCCFEAGRSPLVSNWSLLASGHDNSKKTVTFDYFNRLEEFAAGHRIKLLDTFEAVFGENQLSLNGCVQTGGSITPSFFWSDSYGRVLIARYGLCALVYNESPRLLGEAADD